MAGKKVRRKRTHITVQKREVVTVRVTAGSSRAACPHCLDGMLMSLAEAMQVTSVSVRAIHRWVEDGKLHFVESSAGQVEICSASLKRLATRV